MPRVSINLVTWNGERYIENCLRSVLNQTFRDFSIIIIDNGSTDQTLELISERFPHLNVIKHKENLGFAKAHNQAIHWTGSDYILCLNQDVVLDQNFLQAMVLLMDSRPLCGAVTGKILRLQDDQETKYIDSAGLKISKGYRVMDSGSAEIDEGQYDIIEEVFGVSGAVPLYRRKALEEISFQKEFFDESFFSYKEDVDLSARLRIAGWQIWRAPGAVAYHDRTVTVPLSKETKMLIIKNRR
ncbi:glycosyltransferase family 2 protein, partial [Candidatus Falkowbacteria bacterium]|nr:glycosyltransferase family 2 protein [Candidatus Falkowbacteria bacterium]